MKSKIEETVLEQHQEEFNLIIDSFSTPPNSNLVNILEIVPLKNRNLVNGIIFLKPELVSIPQEKLRLFFQFFSKKISEFSITLEGISILSGPFILSEGLFDKNYEKIKSYSGLCYESKKAIESQNILKLRKFSHYERIFGGMALSKKGYSPEYIMKLWEQAQSTFNIIDDLFAAKVELEGEPIILINGFYPYQRKQYEPTGSKIVLFFFRSEEPFKKLKKNFQGSAQESGREPGSIRQYIADNKDIYEIQKFSTSINGIHLSENSRRGLLEVKYFADAIDTSRNDMGK